MAFFEQIGKRLTDTGQNMMQQTKNIADVTKLNSVISEGEKKISQLFFEIGQSYYEKHKNDNTSEQSDKIAEITALYADILKNREKIKQIKGIVKCENCGGDIPINAVFCNVCGTKVNRMGIEKGESDSKRVCQNCQTPMGKDDLFCKCCGTKNEDSNE